MALPTNTPQSREEILAQRRAAEEEALLREVDDAVRADDMASFGKRYGRTLGVGIGALVLAFGGYLYWESRQEAAREAQAEALVTALDQAQAGNFAAATESTASIAKDGGEGPRASARMLAAGAAMAQNRPAVAEAGALDAAAAAPAPEMAMAGADAAPRPGFVAEDPESWGSPGRNDSCPCGSGRKFKHCHGRLA